MFDFTQARINMVDFQLRPNGVTDARVLAAFLNVFRETFVPTSAQAVAYGDSDIQLGQGRYLANAMAFAKMMTAAEIKPSDKILEIGCGTGYGAAILAQIAGQVVAVESLPDLCAAARENLKDKVKVSLIEKPLLGGVPEAAPFEVILLSGQVENVPEPLFSQLGEGGRLIAVVGEGAFGRAHMWTRRGTAYTQRYLFDASLATLTEFGKPKAGFAF